MNKHRDVATKRALGIAAVIAISVQIVGALQQAPEVPLSDFGEIRDPKEAYNLLRELAKNAASIDSSLGRSRVSISDGIMVYDVQPVPETRLTTRPSRLTTPLELLIRIEALSRDFRSCLPNQTFWDPPLQRLRSLASNMVDSAFLTVSEHEWRSKNQEYTDRAGGEFATLERDVLAFANKRGLDVKMTRGSPNGYRVEIRIEPPKAHLRFMPFLDYLRCRAFKLNLKDYWVDLYPGTHTLIGRYHYLAEWPASLNGPYEDNFEISEEGMKLTFQPKEN